LKLHKKAQGLSLNTIIIAALVLLVLVVLAIIFGTRAKFFTGQTNNCQAKGGECLETGDSCVSVGLPQIFGEGEADDCEKTNGYCCMDLLDKIENGGLKSNNQ
jgi:hypothetical protein